jgi:hypothetical protein
VSKSFSKMTDMSYGEGEGYDMPGPSLLSKPDHPLGLCITLTKRELEKLDLEEPSEVGDMIHLVCMGRVKSINKTGDSCRIELQLTDMSIENESTETPDDNDN